MSNRDLHLFSFVPLGSRTSCRAVLLVCVLFGVSACKKSLPIATPRGKPPSESVLGQVTLSKEAEKRLGIPEGLIPLATTRQSQRRLFRGEVVLPPGRSAWLVAPHAGIVLAATGALLPHARSRVQAGQVLATLSASLAPTERAQLSTVRVDADAQVARARVQDEASELTLHRAERLLAEAAVGTKVLDEARAQREIARSALQAALAQQAAVLGTGGAAALSGGTARGSLSQTQIVAPISGIVREVRVAAHALVLPGSQLIEIVDDEVLWVRVSVHAAAIASLAPSGAAYVDDLSAPWSSTAVSAHSADHAPWTANPQQQTVDRFFVLPGHARFQAGQTVAVWLPLRTEEESLTVKSSALLYDPSGGSWVYQHATGHSFVRRRVEVVRIEDGVAFLRPGSLQRTGLQIGDRIVTSGAMELYGAEFGSSK